MDFTLHEAGAAEFAQGQGENLATLSDVSPPPFCNLGQIISKSQDIKASKAVTHAISWVGTEARTWQ